MKKNKGFTLVELLAVIVILAIILAIAVPGISGLITSSKKNALEASVKLIIKGIDYAVLKGDSVTTGSAIAPTSYGASASDITTITISSTSPTTLSAVAINATGKFAGCTVAANATYSSVTATCS